MLTVWALSGMFLACCVFAGAAGGGAVGGAQVRPASHGAPQGVNIRHFNQSSCANYEIQSACGFQATSLVWAILWEGDKQKLSGSRMGLVGTM